MLMLILTWVGAVLALSLILIMALGPVVVEIDSWWYERKHNQRRAHRAEPQAEQLAEPSTAEPRAA
jgi:hypothetical protein